MSTILDAHEKALRSRHRAQSLDRYSKWRWREALSFAIALIGVSAAFVCGIITWKYASTIVEVDKTRTTDKFGQTISMDGSIYRIPADTQMHSLFNRFVDECFTVYASAHALQRRYAECESFFDGGAPLEKAKMDDYWAKHSPLHPDGYFDVHAAHEIDATVVSINTPGTTDSILVNGVLKRATEYEVEFRLTYADHAQPDDYWNALVSLTSGGEKTDVNPWGRYITHFSLSEMK